MTTEIKVIPLPQAQTLEAARVLTRAFREDPSTLHCCSGAPNLRAMHWSFTVFVRQAVSVAILASQSRLR